MNISIRKRIYGSFALLVTLFMTNGIITFITLVNNQKQSNYIYGVIDPSLQLLDNFNQMLVESKMYTTNWVFLRYSQSDKDALLKLHNVHYYKLKLDITVYSRHWKEPQMLHDLANIYTDFDQLLSFEKAIIHSLKKFEDYNDPILKLEAERIVEDEVLPRTIKLKSSLNHIIAFYQDIRTREAVLLKYTSLKLRVLVIALTIITICTGILLSVYMTRIITWPINRIRQILNDLGRGIIQENNLDDHSNKDEIGEMIRSVNRLSGNLEKTASFAQEVGLRNFDAPFVPLSDEDTLGKSLIAMRNNLKASEKELRATTIDLLHRNKELEDFTYIVSHNLRAPVANIMGFTHILSSLGNDAILRRQDLLSGIAVSVQKLDIIIVDLNRILQRRRGQQAMKETGSIPNMAADITKDITELPIPQDIEEYNGSISNGHPYGI